MPNTLAKGHRTGILFGCFIPLHIGHMALIDKALMENDRIILGVTGYDMDRGRDFIPFLRRIRLMREIYGDKSYIHLSEVDDRKLGLTGTFSLDAWKIWCNELFGQAGIDPNTSNEAFHWYTGEQSYVEKLEQIYPDHIIHLENRSIIPVSGTEIRSNPAANKPYIHPVFWQYLQEHNPDAIREK